MSDDRRVDDLSIEELEAVIQERRRLELAQQFAENDPDSLFRPITVEPLVRQRKRRRRTRPRNWRDNVLLLIEIAAVVGLIAIIVSSLGTLQTLNQESAQAAKSVLGPTSVAPVAPASTTALPGSSFPPADANLSELPGSSDPPAALPAAIGVSVQNVPVLPPPTPGPQSPTRLVVTKLGLDWPIVEGDDWEALKRGVGHHIGSANPGERGNLVLSGHDDVFGEVFKDLDQLLTNDLIVVYAGGHAFHYAVRARRVVSPTDLSVLDQTREPVVTLITCAPYRIDTQRLVVIAQLVP